MNPIFGKELQLARERQGLSIEEAAHATRMRPSMVEALETGNIEAFPNPAYAKSFLLLYGKYLRMDVKSVAAEIDTDMHVAVEDYQYLAHAKETTPEPARRGDFARPHSLPSWTPVIALAGTTAVVVFVLLLMLNMSRIGDVADKPLPKAGTQGGGIEPVAAGAQPVRIETPTKARRVVEPPVAPPPVAVVAAAEEPPAPDEPTETPPIDEPPVAATPSAQAGNLAPAPVYPKDPPPPIAKTPPPVKAAPPEPPAAEPVTTIDGVEVRPARVISPAAKIAMSDAALLAQVGTTESAPQTPPPLTGLTRVDELEEPEEPETAHESSPLAKDPNTIEIEPVKKTWIVIRRQAGGLPVFEDYLYPSARPMRLPSGKYFIEVRDADAVELRRAGKVIPYVTGGVAIE